MPEFGEALSERELDVLRLVATGATNQQIARDLYISVNTVKAHMRNIFTKLGVASRTEASMYAIREGWVAVEPTAETEEPPLQEVEGIAEEGSPEQASAQPTFSWRRWPIMAGFAVLVLALTLSLSGVIPNPFLTPTVTLNSPTPLPGWQRLADMPTARSDLALVPFGEYFYAIGGRDYEKICDIVERFDPLNNTWTPLAAKPTAASEMQGAVLGGRIYVPGGCDGQGVPTEVTEVYDIERNLWVEAEPLPYPLSHYALVSFEGKLYLFGGWDGNRYRDEILQYDPAADHWLVVGQLPFPWGYAGAVVASDRIFLLGGSNQQGPINVVLEYSPAFGTLSPKPLPGISLGQVHVTAMRDYLFLLAQQDGSAAPQFWRHNVRTELWQQVEDDSLDLYPGTAIASIGAEHILLVGGRDGETPLAQTRIYQVLFSAVPVVPAVAP